MMQKHIKPIRFLSLAPATKGLGYAVFENHERFAAYGVKSIKSGDKNSVTVAKAEELMAFFLPTLLVLYDTKAKGSRRHPRIRELTDQLVALAKQRKVKVKLYARGKVMKTYFPEGNGTQQTLAELLGRRFPEDLQEDVPERRAFWKGKARALIAFEAAALALLPRELKIAQLEKELHGPVSESDLR